MAISAAVTSQLTGNKKNTPAMEGPKLPAIYFLFVFNHPGKQPGTLLLAAVSIRFSKSIEGQGTPPVFQPTDGGSQRHPLVLQFKHRSRLCSQILSRNDSFEASSFYFADLFHRHLLSFEHFQRATTAAVFKNLPGLRAGTFVHIFIHQS